jgi:hypothetical protein
MTGAGDDRPDGSRLLSRVLGPAGPELTCEECFAELDRYAELLLAASEADRKVPGMRAHLEGCPACGEDLASLLALLRSGPEADAAGGWSGEDGE